MNISNCNCDSLIQRQPQARAVISGSDEYPDIHGVVRFYAMNNGTLVYADINGLPHTANRCSQEVFGFHIHSGNSCSGNSDDPFADAKTHYDKRGCGHPSHSGDLPPLFGNSGKAVSVFLTNRFSINEILGKAIIIHAQPDDFTTQPSGNSGRKIACGIIMPSGRR